ncbi:MAG: hypothetical protein CM1200mP12_08450 [Gammaproteobacteria bacterium]|nr:MAG: hypothetical protein CM1200mP12_08450 [Gammaproteobacteria bacterium]
MEEKQSIGVQQIYLMQWVPFQQNTMKTLISFRAFDSDRDGFVIAGGGGAIILEELNQQKKEGSI